MEKQPENESPLISLIIPVYNTEKYIRECLDSVLAQTFQDFEIIIIDDDSTDSSFSICSEYANKDKRIHLFKLPHQGAGSVRNQGLDKAVGTYVMFLDADDYIVPAFFEKMLQHRLPDENGLVVCRVFNFSDKSSPELWREQLESFKVENDDILFEKYYFPLIQSKYHTICFRTLIPKKLIEVTDSRFSLTSYREDFIFLLGLGQKIKYYNVIDEGLVYHRRHSESLTGIKYRKTFFEEEQIYFKQFRSIIESTNFSRERQDLLIGWRLAHSRNELIFNACGSPNYKRECRQIYQSFFFREKIDKQIYKNWFKAQGWGNKFVALIVKTRLVSIQYLLRKLPFTN